MPVCLLEPIWEQLVALVPAQPVVSPTHPLGCHRRRVPDRVVLEHVVAALVHGSGYELIVDEDHAYPAGMLLEACGSSFPPAT